MPARALMSGAGAWLLAAALLAGGCDSGDSAARARTGTGTVAVLLTDGPSADFDAIEVTVTGIDLLSSAGPVTVFSGSQTVDLLDLRNHATLFALGEEVPALAFSKIRLLVSRIRLLRVDADGAIAESIDARLPGGGRIDLNLRGPVRLQAGATLLLQLDIDADKSLHLHRTGSGDWRFRPVIFVTALGAGESGRLTRIAGIVSAAGSVPGAFTLCQEGNRRRCLDVHTGEATATFASDGLGAAVEDIVAGDALTAIGFLHSDPAASGLPLILAAEVIELGPPGTFESLAGTLLSVPDARGEFGFEVDPGAGAVSQRRLTMQLQPQTRIFHRDGALLDATSIEAGRHASADGVAVPGAAGDPDLFRTALLVLEDVPATTLGGEIVSQAPQLTLATGSGDRCLELDAGLVVLLTDGGSVHQIAAADLRRGQAVEAWGTPAPTGCLAADTIVFDTGK